MVKTMENGVSVAPFLLKCYEMVDDESTDELISWNQINNSFIIWNESRFASELLPKYFKHSNMASFIRQLNIYGFRKIDTDRYEFANDGFLRGQKHLLQTIIRRKQPQNQVQKKTEQHQDKNIESCPLENNDDKRAALTKEVENLKTDKNALMQELVKLRQHQKTSQNNLLLLGEQLQGMEKNQQQMLSFIVMAMQSPGFLVQLVQPVKEDTWFSEPDEGAMVRYNPPVTNENGFENPCVTPSLASEKSMDCDISPEDMRDLIMSLGLLDGSEYDEGMVDQLPWSENGEEGAKVDEEVFQGHVFDYQYQNNESERENIDSVDNLTEQIGLLNSEKSP